MEHIKVDKKKHFTSSRIPIDSQIEELIEKGKISDIISILEKETKGKEFNPLKHQAYSFKFLRNGKYYDAIKLAEHGLHYKNENYTLKRILAEALSHLPQEEQRAGKLFTELIQMFPEDQKFLSTYADFLLRRRRYEEAREIYRRILESDIKNSRTRVDFARSFRMEQKYVDALSVLNETPYPDNPHWLLEKGHCLVEMGDGKNAISLLSKARRLITYKEKNLLVRIEPMEKAADALNGKWKDIISWAVDKPLKHWAQQTVWRSIRRGIENNNAFGEAIDILKNKIIKYPDDLVIPHEINHLVKSGKMDTKRKEIIEELLKISPTNPNVLHWAVMDASEEEAINLWEKTWFYTIERIRTIPHYVVSTIAQDYSRYLRQNNKPEAAISVLDEARSTGNIFQDFDLELERAICLGRLGNYKEAMDILGELIKQRPNNPAVLDQLGVCLRATGRLEEALDIFRMKIKFQDDLPGRQGLGKTLFQLGKYTEAKDIFETILKEHPDDIEAKWTLSQVFSKEGDYDSAKKLLSNISSTDLASRGLELFDIEKRISDLGKRIIEQDAELERTRTLAYLGTMATATAHELNQPIGIIRAITDAALNDIRDGFIKEKEIPSLLKKILMQTDRLAGRIENLRAFARSDRTKREKVMLNNLLEQMGQMFFEQFKHRNIILEIETDKTRNAPIVWANPVQIEEVLINLITNARDAVEGLPKAWVKVRCWRDKYGGSWFTVEDNGPGLNQEYRKQIFTPFVSTKSTEKGTGLGLYISRRLISELGGRLNYEDRLTKGAKFNVYLPPIKEN